MKAIGWTAIKSGTSTVNLHHYTTPELLVADCRTNFLLCTRLDVEQEVKIRIIQMCKKSIKPASILNHLKREFPEASTRDLVNWIDDLIQQ